MTLFPTVPPADRTVSVPADRTVSVVPPLDDEGKVAGSGRHLGEPEQTWEICPPWPQRDWFGSGTLGTCLKSGFSHFPLIRQFMVHLGGQGVICLAHVFSFTS